MTTACRVLATLLLFLGTLATDPEAVEEQCETKAPSDPDDIGGQALLATRVVRNKIPIAWEADDQLPIATGADLGPANRELAALQQLRETVVKQGNATADQLQALLEVTASLLDGKVLVGRATQNVSLDAGQDPLADRERFAKDYVRDGDEPFFIPDTVPQPGVPKPNSTLVYEEPAEKKHVMATYVIVPLAAVFFAVFTISNIMEKYEITALPESGIVIMIGVILGIFMKMKAHFDFFEDPDAWADINSAILNLILLPIIIFASGWAIRRQDFFSQFPYILMFAMAGVGLSTVVIGCLIYFTGSMDLHSVTQWRTAFAYACLISATDPVATLSTYAKLKVDPLLNIMVFGESIINDAVAIVLFNVLNADDYMVNTSGEPLAGVKLLGSILWGIIKIFCTSMLLGICLGMIYTLIAHWADMRHNKKGQILVIFASCYLTYALAESCGMSGIIAEIFSALLMGVYMRPHLSTEGSLLATFFVKQLATLADTAVCLLIGVSVVQLTTKGWYFGLWVMLFCLVGRAFAVFPVALVVNWCKQMMGKANGVPEEGWNLLTPQHMFMMWHAGLRGAIALALSLELGKWVDVLDGPGTRRCLQTATFLLIGAFLLIFGGSTSACLNYLGVPTGQDMPADHLSKTEDMGAVRNVLHYVDKKILSPVLIGHKHNHESPCEEKDVEELLKDVHRW